MIQKRDAYAKVNLFLDVGAVRSDGFHEIKSVMQSVTLYDRVTLGLEGDGGISVVSDGGAPSGRDNLVFRAAEAFFSATGIPPRGVSFRIEKRIPIAAGLAGGSSDAAAALLMLNERYGSPLDRESLLRVGANIGSDVPFCMIGGTCIATGRGEKVVPVTSDCVLEYLIVNGGEGVSTPSAYRSLDASPSRPHGDPGPLLHALESGEADSVPGFLFNSFDGVVTPNHPEAARAEAVIRSFGGSPLLCGSGPSVLGLFPDEDGRTGAKDLLASEGFRTFICKTALKNGC